MSRGHPPAWTGYKPAVTISGTAYEQLEYQFVSRHRKLTIHRRLARDDSSFRRRRFSKYLENIRRSSAAKRLKVNPLRALGCISTTAFVRIHVFDPLCLWALGLYDAGSSTHRTLIELAGRVLDECLSKQLEPAGLSYSTCFMFQAFIQLAREALNKLASSARRAGLISQFVEPSLPCKRGIMLLRSTECRQKLWSFYTVHEDPVGWLSMELVVGLKSWEVVYGSSSGRKHVVYESDQAVGGVWSGHLDGRYDGVDLIRSVNVSYGTTHVTWVPGLPWIWNFPSISISISTDVYPAYTWSHWIFTK